MERVSKHNYYLDIAQTVAERSTCLRKKYGAIIVKNDVIVSTGYNGAPRGRKNCTDMGECLRDKLSIPSGTKHEICYAIHAEQNAIIQAAKLGSSIDGATLYCTHQPCVICAKMIVNSGISRVIYEQGYPDEFSLKIFEMAGVALERYTPEEDGKDIHE